MLTAAAIITGTSASSDGICPSGDTLKTWGQNRNHDYTHNPIHVCQYVMVGDCPPLFQNISLNVSGYITKGSESIPISGAITLGNQNWQTDDGDSYIYYQLNESTGLDGPNPTCSYRICTSSKSCDSSATCVASPPCQWSPGQGEITLFKKTNSCGGKDYDPNSQDCCNGEIYNFATQACCNNKVVEGVTEVIVPIASDCVSSFFPDGCNGYLKSAFSNDFNILAKPYNNNAAMQFVFQKAVCPGEHVKLVPDPNYGWDCDANLSIEFSYPNAPDGILRLRPNGYSHYRMQCNCDVELGCRFKPSGPKKTTSLKSPQNSKKDTQ